MYCGHVLTKCLIFVGSAFLHSILQVLRLISKPLVAGWPAFSFMAWDSCLLKHKAFQMLSGLQGPQALQSTPAAIIWLCISVCECK